MKNLLKILRSFFPRKLPIGMSSFNSWVDDIVLVSGLPNNESVRKLAANFILSIHSDVAYMSIRRVSNLLVKAAANQVAIEVLHPKGLNEIKTTTEASSSLV